MLEDYPLETAIKNLNDPDPDIRKGAAWVIGQYNDARAMAPLISALEDSDYEVRAYAAASLGSLKNTAATKSLLGRVQNDDNIYVRAIAIDSLGQIEDSQAIDILEIVVENDPALRPNAIIALEKIGDKEIGKRALDFLRDHTQSEDIYHASLEVVGKLKMGEGIYAVEPFLRRGDLDLVNPALRALGQIGTEAARQAIENNLPYLSDFDRAVARQILEDFPQR